MKYAFLIQRLPWFNWMSKRYQSDLTDKQGAIIQPLIPAQRDGARPRINDMREECKLRWWQKSER